MLHEPTGLEFTRLRTPNLYPVGTMIAVIGSGYWGKNLVRNFHALGALAAVCDKNPTLLENAQAAHPGVRICMALPDMLADPEITGVAIATPAESHFVIAREALLAGKHVFVEKPLTLDEGEGRELIDLAARKGLVLMVGHLLRYHPVFMALQDLAQSGALGRINYIYSNRLNLGKVRREENILWSFAPHDISMILALAGEEPERVWATGGNYLHRRIADVTTTHLDFPSGLKAHVFVSWLHPFKEQKLVVVGERQMAVFDDTRPWEEKLLLYPHEIRWENGAPVPARCEPVRVEVPQSEPLRSECQHFLDCIASGASPTTDGQEGLRVLKVLMDAQRSLDAPDAPPVHPEPASQAPAARHGDGAFVHPTAVVDDRVTIGSGTKIWHFSHILAGTSIGEKVNIGQNVVAGPDVRIGNGCKIQNNVSVYKGVVLEDNVFCGPSMVFTNVHAPRAFIPGMDRALPTVVRTGATLGANCTIVCGNEIGQYAFVAAGAVVTRPVPPHGLVMGNPARLAGWVCRCGAKLDEHLCCPGCGDAYERDGDGLASTRQSPRSHA